jgi:peptidoglycan/LPS O-acetylase OafA/YrhL
MHIHSNQQHMGLPALPGLPILSKGLLVVSLFFVLSGFLITYSLLKEQTKTATINVKATK